MPGRIFTVTAGDHGFRAPLPGDQNLNVREPLVRRLLSAWIFNHASDRFVPDIGPVGANITTISTPQSGMGVGKIVHPSGAGYYFATAANGSAGTTLSAPAKERHSNLSNGPLSLVLRVYVGTGPGGPALVFGKTLAGSVATGWGLIWDETTLTFQFKVGCATTIMTAVSQAVPSANRWYDLAIVFNGNGAASPAASLCQFYINATAVPQGSSTNGSGAINDDTAASMLFGGDGSTNFLSANCAIAHAYIYNRLLTDGDVKTITETPYAICAQPANRRWFSISDALGNLFSPSAGSLTLAGTTAALAFGLVATGGSLGLTGGTPALVIDAPRAVSSPAALTLTGPTPILDLGLRPAAGALAVSGTTPTLDLALRPAATSAALSGTTPSVVLSTVREPTAASLALAGATPIADLGLPATGGALALSGTTPLVFVGTTVQPASGSLVLAGATPGLDLALRPAAGALVLSGTTPTVSVGSSFQPTIGALALSGTAAALDLGLPTAAGSLALSGGTPALSIGTVRSPSVGALTLTGTTPGQQVGFGATAASLALNGGTPVLAIGIAPSAGALTLAGTTPARVISTVRSPTAGTLTLAGATPTLVVQTNTTLTPAGTALALSPATPGLTIQGGPATVSLGSIAFTHPRLTVSGFTAAALTHVAVTALTPLANASSTAAALETVSFTAPGLSGVTWEHSE